jgi:hypothetical protein
MAGIAGLTGLSKFNIPPVKKLRQINQEMFFCSGISAYF